MKPTEIRLLDQDYGSKNYDKSLIYIITSIVIFGAIVTVTLITHCISGASQLQPHGAVSSDVKVCSDIGIHALKRGGSAVDGAIATLFCLGVVNSAHSGIGGGGFMIIHSHKSDISQAIDFRETLPQSVNPNKNSATAIGIPGEVKGMYLAHKLYGKSRWEDLIKPSIRLAKTGYRLTDATAKALKTKFVTPDVLVQKYPKLAKLYTTDQQPSGLRFLEAGEMITHPELAETLTSIARDGPTALYEGPIAQGIVKTVNENGGNLTPEDLYNYGPVQREPQHLTFSNGRFHILTMPPPSAGPVLSLVLKLLERLGLFGLLKDPGSPDRLEQINNVVRKSLKERNAEADGKGIVPKRKGPAPRSRYPTLYRAVDSHDSDSDPDLDSAKPVNGTAHESLSAARSGDARSSTVAFKESWADGNHYGTDGPSDGRLFANLPARHTGLYYHWLVESMKFGQAYKAFLGDFAPMLPTGTYNNESFDNVKEVWSSIFETENIDEIVASISNKTTYDFTATSHYLPPNLPGTAHVSVMDQDELIVSVTSTINNLFGSKLMTDHGILLNDEMYDFNLEDNNSNNKPLPGKRPLSSMVPTIIYESNMACGLRMALGGSNGSRITSGVVQVLLNILVFGDSLEAAMARPRLFANARNNYVEVEANFPSDVREELVGRNHVIVEVSDGLNSVLPIMKVKDTLWATSDPRKSSIQSAAIY